MNTKLYEAPLMEFLSVELHSCFAASEYVNTPKGLDDLKQENADWD